MMAGHIHIQGHSIHCRLRISNQHAIAATEPGITLFWPHQMWFLISSNGKSSTSSKMEITCCGRWILDDITYKPHAVYDYGDMTL